MNAIIAVILTAASISSYASDEIQSEPIYPEQIATPRDSVVDVVDFIKEVTERTGKNAPQIHIHIGMPSAPVIGNGYLWSD